MIVRNLYKFSSAIALRSDEMRFHRTDGRDARRDLLPAALGRYNPIAWNERVAPDSRLVVGRFDHYVPRARGLALLDRARRRIISSHLMQLPFGHLAVLAVSGWLQQRWLRAAAKQRSSMA